MGEPRQVFFFSTGGHCSVDTGLMFCVAVSIRMYALGVLSTFSGPPVVKPILHLLWNKLKKTSFLNPGD